MAMTPGILFECLRYGTRLRPHFVCAGFAKCGTTSLYGALNTHPQVMMPEVKELNFFSRHYRLGRRWYAAQFPRRWEAEHAKAISGDVSPAYLPHNKAAMRIARFFGPEAKVIVTMRDPVERAWSHYWHRRIRNEEELDFDRALERDWRRLELDEAYAEAKLAGRTDVEAPRPSKEWNRYITAGRYVRLLRRFMRQAAGISPHIVLFEELLAQPQAELDRLACYLGIEPGCMELPHLNAGTYPPIPERWSRRLREFYAPYNDELEELIGRQLPWQ